MPMLATVLSPLFTRSRRSWLPHQRFAELPRNYRVYLILTIGILALSCAALVRRVDPVLTVIVAAATFISYGFSPVTPAPGGGFLFFDMPTRYGIALLFDPATVLVGVAAGIGMGAWLVHKREPWRAIANAAGSAFNVTIASAAVGWLLPRMGLAPAMVVAPTIVVTIAHVFNEAMSAVMGYCRHGVPMWPEFKASLAEHIGDHAMDIVFLLPLAAGAVLLAPRWWPALLLVSLPMTWLNAWYMLSQFARFGEGRTTVVAHALPSDDPLLRRIAEDLGQGVGLLTADGVLLGMTVAGSHAFGREHLPADTRLIDLCSPLDAPAVARAIARVCRTTDEVAVDVRTAGATEAPRWLHLRFVNRLRDPAIHRIIVTIRDLADDAVVSHRLRGYADHALAGQIIAAQEEERTHMSRELEDNVGQVLTVVRNLLEQVQQAATALQRGLKPPALVDLGLVEAIRTHCAELDRAGTEITIDSRLAPGHRFPGNIEVTAYRIVHEGLKAVLPTGVPARAVVSIAIQGTALVIVLEGSRSPEHPRALDRGPLLVLQERAGLVGGHVAIERLDGGAVRVTAELPLAGPFHADPSPGVTGSQG